MNDLRQQHGDHTWDIIIEYFQCPKCQYILEDRKQYEDHVSFYQKNLTCERCQHTFIMRKRKRKTLGSLLGNPLQLKSKKKVENARMV